MKKKVGWMETLLHFCLAMTCIILTWELGRTLIDVSAWWFQPIIVTILGMGGLAIYILLGHKLNLILRELEK